MNIKYLAITVGSIFLALGLGIFIGLVISSGNTIENQTGDVVSQIEDQFKYLRDENKKNRDEIQEMRDTNSLLNYALGTMSDKVIENQLEGRNIAVVALNEDGDVERVKALLQKANTNITSVTYIKNGFYEEGSVVEKRLEGNVEIPEDMNMYSFVGGELSRVLLNGESSPAIVDIVESGYFNIEGDYNALADEILVIGGRNDKKHGNEDFMNSLLDSVRKSGKIAVGVEDSNAKVSDIAKFKEYEFSTVDNINQHTGELSLVVALRGAKGNYGGKDGDNIKVPDVSLLD